MLLDGSLCNIYINLRTIAVWVFNHPQMILFINDMGNLPIWQLSLFSNSSFERARFNFDRENAIKMFKLRENPYSLKLLQQVVELAKKKRPVTLNWVTILF